MLLFLQGCTVMATWLIGLYFLKFWRRTGDRMFAIFAASFWLEAFNRTLVASSGPTADGDLATFLLRLFSYSLILLAVWDKNQTARS